MGNHGKEGAGDGVLEMEHGEGGHRRIGVRLISAGVLNEDQCDTVLLQQEELDKRGKHVRFGELAVQMGFCTRAQVESLPDYLGERLVKAGILTPEQQALLVTWQEKLREKGIHIRYGDLASSEGVCTAAQIEAIIRHHHNDGRTVH